MIEFIVCLVGILFLILILLGERGGKSSTRPAPHWGQQDGLSEAERLDFLGAVCDQLDWEDGLEPGWPALEGSALLPHGYDDGWGETEYEEEYYEEDYEDHEYADYEEW